MFDPLSDSRKDGDEKKKLGLKSENLDRCNVVW